MKKFIRIIWVVLLTFIMIGQLNIQAVHAQDNAFPGPATGDVYLDSFVDGILNRIIAPYMSDEEKIKAVYNHLIFDYTHDIVDNIKIPDSADDSPLKKAISYSKKLFVDGYGVCDDFSAAFYILTSRMGFECNVVDGKYLNRSGSTVIHAWNQIKINDAWFWVDVYVEGLNYRNQKLKEPLYYFYLKGDEEWKATHAWDYDAYTPIEKPAPAPVAQADNSPQGNYSIIVNGTRLNLKLPVLNINGRLMYPFRQSMEAMGAETAWYDSTKTVTGKLGDYSVAFIVDSDTYIANGIKIQMEEGSQVFINGERVYIPIRNAAEALGFSVSWDEKSQTISLNKIPAEAKAASDTSNEKASIPVYFKHFNTNKLERLGINAPLIARNSTVLVSCNELAEKLGTKIEYLPAENVYVIVQPINSKAYAESVTAIYINNNKVGTLLIPQNGSSYSMLSYGIVAQSPPEIIDGHLMIPIDAIPLAFQCDVECYMQNNTVLIRYSGPPSGADEKRENTFKVIPSGIAPELTQ